MGGLCVVNVCKCDDGVFVLVERNLPHPVADVVGLVDDGQRIVVGISSSLVHGKRPVVDDAQLFTVDVAQDRTIAFVDVDDVEVQPVGLFVVRMSRGVAEVDLVLAVVDCTICLGPKSKRQSSLLSGMVNRAMVGCQLMPLQQR